MKRRVFVSYTREDEGRVRPFLAALENVDISGWMDAADLPAGAPISRVLREAIQRASAVVVFYSAAAAESRWVDFEIGAAQGAGKQVIGVLLEGQRTYEQTVERLRETILLDATGRSPVEVARDIERRLSEAAAPGEVRETGPVARHEPPRKVTVPRVIVLAGAGMSSLAAVKTLRSIVDGIEGMHVSQVDEEPAVNLVKETWKIIKGLEGDKANLELLLARLKYYSELADAVTADRVLSQELGVSSSHILNGQFKLKWENALAYCLRLMLDNYGPHRVNRSAEGYPVIHWALKMLATANNNSLELFTTNYDCVLNVIAEHSSDVNLFSHINNQNGIFEKGWFVANQSTYQRNNPDICIHRLHGCVAWFRDPRSAYGLREVHGAGTSLAVQDQSTLKQMAIKLAVDDKIGNFPAFSLAFEEFRRELEWCETLLVWGYSFRDVELLRCMLNVAAARKAGPFRVVCIDPYLSKVQIKDNIRSTVVGVPAVSSEHMDPEVIEWVPQDGYDALLDALKTTLGI